MSSRRASGLVLAATCAAAVAGCGVSTPAPRTPGAVRTPEARPTPPSHVAARGLPSRGGLRRGAALPSADLGVRILLDDRHGFALATTTAHGSRTYPASSGDGGRRWRVAGPALHIPGDKGARAVSEPGMAGPRLFYAWSPGNPVIDATADGGRHWWQTFLPDIVLSVQADRGQRGFANGVDAIVEAPAGNADGEGAQLWEYRTTDGRHWRFIADLSAIA